MATLQTASERTITSDRKLDLDIKEQDYYVYSQREIYFFLDGIMQEKSLISLHLGRSSRSIILSSILAIDLQKKQLIIDYGVNEALNRIVLKRGRVRCTTNHNRVGIEFECSNLRQIQFEGRTAFSADIPESLRRLQRRNFYRMITPIATPAICVMYLLESQESPVTYNLLDISCGGMALVDQPGTETALEVGEVYPNCRVDLPGDEELFGSIETAIRVVHVGSVILDNGHVCPRISCEFLDLPEKVQVLIQRYIVKLEQQARKFDTRFDF